MDAPEGPLQTKEAVKAPTDARKDLPGRLSVAKVQGIAVTYHDFF